VLEHVAVEGVIRSVCMCINENEKILYYNNSQDIPYLHLLKENVFK
jgi:hypothetical protein